MSGVNNVVENMLSCHNSEEAVQVLGLTTPTIWLFNDLR
jgi:hypothetical protein